MAQKQSTELKSAVVINDYQVPIWKMLCEGVSQIKGAGKILFISSIIFLIPTLFLGNSPYLFYLFIYLVHSVYIVYLLSFCMVPLLFGLIMLGVRWIVEKRIYFSMLFEYFKKKHLKNVFLLMSYFFIRVWLPAVVLLFLLNVQNFLFSHSLLYTMFFPLFSIFPSAFMPHIVSPLFSNLPISFISVGVFYAVISLFVFYWFIRHIMAVPLVFKKGISPWAALTVAGRAFDRRGFKLFILFFTQYVGVCLLLYLVTIPIALVMSFYGSPNNGWDNFFRLDWVFFMKIDKFSILQYQSFVILLMPWLVCVNGILYREMFENKNEAEHVRP